VFGTLTHSESPATQLHAPQGGLLLSRVLVLLGFASQVAVAWYFRSLTWDDSAITLGFARTFAATGRIEPTPGSGIVEGYSTTLWMLLMAAAAKLLRSPAGVLAFAKIATLALNLVNIVLIRSWLCRWQPEILANLVAGTMGCTLMLYETINGMETPLLLSLIFIMLLLASHRNRTCRLLYLLAGCALLLVRFEAVWLLVPFILAERPTRQALTSAATWTSALIASSIVRIWYFGSFVPNTIIAKRGPPYSASTAHGEFYRHLAEAVTISKYIAPYLLISIALYIYCSFRRSEERAPSGHEAGGAIAPFRFSVIFALFSIFLSVAIGQNWGPTLRSFYPGAPILLALALLPMRSFLTSERAARLAVAAICLCSVLRLGARVHEMSMPDGPIYMPYATVDDVGVTSGVLRDIQKATHQHDLLFAGPDMGAVMLYSDGIRIIDLGLLCDPVLARKRYQAIDSYVLEQRRPDVIEVHGRWSELTRLSNYPYFESNYQPVYVDGTRMFVKRQLIAQIDPQRLRDATFSATGHVPGEKPFYTKVDFTLNQHFGHYLLLDVEGRSSLH